ncbi:conserved oligomeric Golgi complex subunit 7-like [Humulus lupulus]|uniref:conserved oligomeric Golgi complex subunit 7-like n=1 Tax=Humulus lupulus TaxID=3486 RepID=UPI002B4064AE|nr:conserved oligomeric Golgi complex subunit 7-like [Humulus lupulus]
MVQQAVQGGAPAAYAQEMERLTAKESLLLALLWNSFPISRRIVVLLICIARPFVLPFELNLLVEGSSAESIVTLAKVDTVKQRMEAAYETFQDAAGLTQLSSTVEDVFASGDLPRAAETLANMRHCLSAVGEVAEFANVRKQLEVLEDRLDAMVQPRLTGSIIILQIDIAQNLRGILIRIGRFKSLELHYTKVHLKPIKQLWEDFDSKQCAIKLANEKTEAKRLSSHEFQSSSSTISFASWLPSFYDELILYLDQEWKWCMVAFPEDYKTLVPKLLIETMATIGASFISRINLSIGEIVPEIRALGKGLLDIMSGDMPKGIKIQRKHLEALIKLHNVTQTFAKNIQHSFSDSDLRVLMDTLKAVYSPFESFKQRYGQMEWAILSSEIAGVDLRGAVTRGVGAQGIELSETVRRMEEVNLSLSLCIYNIYTYIYDTTSTLKMNYGIGCIYIVDAYKVYWSSCVKGIHAGQMVLQLVEAIGLPTK